MSHGLNYTAAWLLLGGRSIMLRGFYVILGTTQEINKHRYVRQIHEVILGQNGGFGQLFSGAFG